jgi:hypothetical protein
MPAVQKGSVDKPGASWRARWSDELGKRRQKKGFRTRTEAKAWVREEIERVRKRRIGCPDLDPQDVTAFVPRVAHGVAESLLDVGEVAERLGVRPEFVFEEWEAYDEGDPDGMPGYRLRDSVWFTWSEIEAWCRRVLPPTASPTSRRGDHHAPPSPRYPRLVEVGRAPGDDLDVFA